MGQVELTGDTMMPKNDKKAAENFADEGMLVKECPVTGWFITKRNPMCLNPKGRYHLPYQMLSPDQSQWRLFKNCSLALQALAALPLVASIEKQSLMDFVKQGNHELAA